jgi:DNA-binding MarR family transcriptional regulator
MIVREVNPKDRRSFVVTLTASGKNAARRVHRSLQKLEDAALARLSERDLRGFQAVLHILQECIVQPEQELGR